MIPYPDCDGDVADLPQLWTAFKEPHKVKSAPARDEIVAGMGPQVRSRHSKLYKDFLEKV